MIGHHQILALRATGRRPGAIFIADRPAPKWAGRDLEDGGYPSVYVAGDNPETTDVRFAFGCVVHLHVDDEQRAVAWLDTFLKVRPKMVVQCTGREVHVWHP